MSEFAQPQGSTTIGILSGTVSDPSGAKIRNAIVHVRNTSFKRDTRTDNTGRFSLPLPLGIYDVTIVASGFKTYSTNIALTARDAHDSIDAKLVIATQEEQITVQSENAENAASTDAADNKSALIFKGDQLKAFSDDDSTFQQEVLAMAGGNGPIPPEILIDGFANGRFPPKNTIRELHINQNPYSAQYDSLGFGRVEVFTKPGTDKLHGNFTSSGTDNVFNSRNPYLCVMGCPGTSEDTLVEPPYYTLNLDGNLSGAFNNRTSFFVSGTYNDQQNNAIVNAIDLTLLTTPPLSEAVPAPQVTQTYSGRLDRQVTANNSFTGRYEYNQVSLNNSGVGLLVLPTEGLNTTTTTQTLQLTDTQLIGAKMVSEAHFQYIRTRLDQSPASTAPTILIEGVANGGGNPAQTLHDNQDRYEFQESLSIERGKHFFHIGGRYRLLRDANLSTANYNGQFTFPTLADYQLTIDSKGTEFGATQFNLTNGQPSAVVLTGDLGVYAEDEWKVRPDLTLDFGFRFESQTAVPDHFDPAPRAGFAWAVGQGPKKQPLFVLRGGGGFFYDRFDSTNILTAIRQQSGTLQRSYYVQNPQFYTTDPTDYAKQPILSQLSSTPPTLYNIDPHMRTEYALVGGFTLERNIGKIGSISAVYYFVRGDHMYLSRNINAPLPGTYNPADPNSGVRPLGGTQNIYQFGSGGIWKENVLSTNISLHPTKRISLFAFSFYTPSNNSDASSATSFPSNQYDPSADFGRVTTPRLQFFTGPNLQLPFGFTGGLFFSLQSHAPFNITTGTDLNGDTIYNDRPAFATNPTANSVIYKTRFGTFDANPQPGEAIIPVNYGDGPRYVFLSVNLGKTFKIGPRPAASALPPGAPAPKGPAPKPDRPYSLSFTIEADNILNHVNPGPPVGVLSSPFFGESISLNAAASLGGLNPSANRIITLRTSFSF